MPLHKIIVKNYKSLKDLQLDLKPFMVFIGPNNAGKSNIFDCLQFLSDFVKRGREGHRAVRERGGFDQIVFNGDIGQTISFELFGSIRVKEKERHYRYFVELSGGTWEGFSNKYETFSLRENSSQKLLEFPTKDNMARTWDESGKERGGYGGGNQGLYLSYYYDESNYPVLGHFSNEVKNWSFFNFFPGMMRESLPVRKELQLLSFGENLSLLFHTLQTEYPQKFKEIEGILKSAIPEIEELTTALTSHETGRTYVRVREKSIKPSIPALGMSDGTLRLLGHLATLYLPTLPPLVCFEEPENYVHARLLELIVDLLKNASEKTQVFITTHSPYLVDFLQPEDLYIVEKHDGATQVKKAEDKKDIKEALKTLGLGEMWYAGSLGGNP